MKNIRKKEVLYVLTFFAAFFFITNQCCSLKSLLRRLGESDSFDPIEDLTEFYNQAFEWNVDYELAVIQQKVRVRRECKAYPGLDIAPEDFVGTDHQDSHVATVACVPFHYRIPTSSTRDIKDTIVFGILSGSRRSRRDTIRQTWGNGKRIFFLMAGSWHDVEEEYNKFGDMIWIDMEDEYKVNGFNPRKGALTTKTGIFVYAMYKHVIPDNPDVKYVFKTDDDSYVDKIQIEREIEGTVEMNYWGQCRNDLRPNRDENNRWYTSFHSYPYTYFPAYCQGSGYGMSTKFLECMVGNKEIEKTPYTVNEDVYIGLLAERCDMEPNLWSLSTQQETIRKDLNRTVAVQHNVPSDQIMALLHRFALKE